MSDSEECKTCGRPDKGHWIGCAEASSERPEDDATSEDAESVAGMCTYEECVFQRRSADKRVKFCELHSDPKNRK